MPPIEAAQTVTDILRQLIAIPSVNPMGRDVAGPIYLETRLSDWLVGFFRSIGARHERIEVVPGRANVIARHDAPGRVAPGHGAPNLTLLLDAHQDTVPVEGMTIAPFDPQVRDGCITGRGACDVKGGLAAMLFAFARLVREKPAGGADVILSCTCDEESGTLGVADLVNTWRTPGRCGLIQAPPDGAIVAEPTQLDVVVAHRGVTRFRLHTRGKACHSSDPSRGISAIYRMARVLQCLQDYAAALVRSIPPHPLCGGATLSVGRIEGGISVNIVPDHCVIEIDRRVIPGEDPAAVVPAFRQFLASRLDFDVEFDPPWIESAPLSDANNAWLAGPLLECASRRCGPRRAIGVPFCTHASQIGAAGVPSVVFGPGSIDQAHTRDEFIEIDQLEKAAGVYYQFCAQPPTGGPTRSHAPSVV